MLATTRQDAREQDGPDENPDTRKSFAYLCSCDSHGNLLCMPGHAGLRAQDGL